MESCGVQRDNVTFIKADCGKIFSPKLQKLPSSRYRNARIKLHSKSARVIRVRFISRINVVIPNGCDQSRTTFTREIMKPLPRIPKRVRLRFVRDIPWAKDAVWHEIVLLN